MDFTFDIRNSAGTVEIDINGTIGGLSGDEHAVSSYNEFTRKVREIGASSARKVIVNIRSAGGSVNDALLIYEQLKALSARVITRCYGYTASAATIIAQSASKGERKMSANGLYLIHQAKTDSFNANSHDLETSLDLLKKSDERIVTIYAEASGRPAEEFEALMRENNGKGRWLSADEALEAGLIDEIIKAEPIKNINEEDIKGLPEPPQINNTMENNGILERISNWFEKRVDGEMAELTTNLAEERAKVDNLVAERDSLKVDNEAKDATIAELTNKVTALEGEVAELKAMAVQPTEPTQQVQDPEPTPAAPQKTANEVAYDKDVEAFK